MSALQQQIAMVIVQVIFYSGLAAPAVMATFWPWWRTELGWSIVAKTLCLSAALLSSMLVAWFGPAVARSAFLQWFTLAALAAIPAVLWWRVWVIWKTQRDGSRHY